MIIWWKMNMYSWFQFCLLSFSPASLHCNLKMSRLTLFTFTLALISCVNGNGDWRPFHFTMLGVPLFLPTSQWNGYWDDILGEWYFWKICFAKVLSFFLNPHLAFPTPFFACFIEGGISIFCVTVLFLLACQPTQLTYLLSVENCFQEQPIFLFSLLISCHLHTYSHLKIQLKTT